MHRIRHSTTELLFVQVGQAHSRRANAVVDRRNEQAPGANREASLPETRFRVEPPVTY